MNAPEARLVCLKQGIAKGDSGVWRLRGRFWPSGAPKKGVKERGAAQTRFSDMENAPPCFFMPSKAQEQAENGLETARTARDPRANMSRTALRVVHKRTQVLRPAQPSVAFKVPCYLYEVNTKSGSSLKLVLAD